MFKICSYNFRFWDKHIFLMQLHLSYFPGILFNMRLKLSKFGGPIYLCSAADLELFKIRDGETTIQIKFAFLRGLGVGGREECCPKTLFWVGGGERKCHDNKSLKVQIYCQTFFSSVQTRGIVKTSGFTRGVCTNR